MRYAGGEILADYPNDNTSGSGALLELAKCFRAAYERNKCSGKQLREKYEQL